MKKIPLIIPSITDEDITLAADVLRSGMLVQGKEVLKAEESLGKLTNTPHAVMVSNGTASLHLALIAMDVKPGDEVIVPAFSYIASANAIELTGAVPVFVDIDIRTFNIDAAKIEAAFTKKTKGIMVVHEFGLACDIETIAAIAKANNLFLLEDAACALGATYKNQPVGSFGDFGSFSFHPRKAITSGEGGLLTTANEALAQKVRILRNHGISVINGTMEFIEAGFNYRLTEFQAALINSQLKRLPEIFRKRNELACLYKDTITNKLFELPYTPPDRIHTWQTFHVIVSSTLNRNELISNLKTVGIETNYGAQCIPAQKFYQQKYKLDCDRLYPNAMKAFKQGLALPLFDKLSKEDAHYVVDTLNKIKQ